MNEQILNLLLSIGSASLIPLAGGVATFLVQKLKMQALNIKGNIWEKTQLAVKTAIFSAEQQGKNGKLATNNDKKSHAIKLATKLLQKQKIKVDPDVLSELVESNIWESLQVVVDVPTVIIPPIEKKITPEIKVEEVVESVG